MRGTLGEKYTPHMIEIDSLRINQVLSSKMTKAEFDQASFDLFIIATCVRMTSDTFSSIEDLGGTPLLEALIVLNHLVRDFQKQNNHQITNVMVLTDGDGGHLCFTPSYSDIDMKSNSVRGRIAYGRIAGGRYRKFDFSNYNETYKLLVENIRETCGANTLGFFLVENDYQMRYQLMNRVLAYKFDKPAFSKGDRIKELMRPFRKNNMLAFSDLAGYNKMIFFKYNYGAVSQRASFKEIDDSDVATPAKLTKEFKNFNASKKSNRVFVNEFINSITTNL